MPKVVLATTPSTTRSRHRPPGWPRSSKNLASGSSTRPTTGTKYRCTCTTYKCSNHGTFGTYMYRRAGTFRRGIRERRRMNDGTHRGGTKKFPQGHVCVFGVRRFAQSNASSTNFLPSLRTHARTHAHTHARTRCVAVPRVTCTAQRTCMDRHRY